MGRVGRLAIVKPPVDVFVEGQGRRRLDSGAMAAPPKDLVQLRAVRLGSQHLETESATCFTNLLMVTST